MRITGILAITVGCLAASGVALAQQAISAKSGMINYIEGRVLLDGKPVEMKFANFPAVSRQSELRTEEGRAEVLLGPGVFLRMGENSAFKMVSDRISDTQLEFLEGAMVIECAQFGKDESVAITYKDARVTLEKNGVYRFDDQPPRLMVYDGEAKVMLGGQAQIVRKSRTLALEGEAVAEKFDSKAGDALFRWAGRRAEYLALANVSAARSADQYGSWGSNGWIFNPYFGMYTFLPMGGFYDSFWGYRYWSPETVYNVYAVAPRYSGGGVPARTVTGTQATSAATRSSVTGTRASSPGHISSTSTVAAPHASVGAAASSGSASHPTR